jgi:hypothetical protein
MTRFDFSHAVFFGKTKNNRGNLNIVLQASILICFDFVHHAIVASKAKDSWNAMLLWYTVSGQQEIDPIDEIHSPQCYGTPISCIATKARTK